MRFNQRVSIDELLKILDGYNYKEFHIHHTWLPDYSHTKKHSPETLNKNMRSYHKGKGWGEIAQHITTYPDGTILIGRNFGHRPASIKGRNTGAFCMEQVGNFDFGHDVITVAQRNITLRLIKYFRGRGTAIKFHREHSSKTCPGTSLQKWGLIEASKYYFETGDLRRGITGRDVLEYQQKLRNLGYPLDTDGSFGPATEKVVKKYQQDKGLPVTGYLDKQTKDFLDGKKKPDPKSEPVVDNGPSDWAAEAWDWAIGRGLTDGTDPGKNCTREMAITMIYRAIGKSGE